MKAKHNIAIAKAVLRRKFVIHAYIKKRSTISNQEPKKCKPFQYFCLENSMDRRTRWATVHGAANSWT